MDAPMDLGTRLFERIQGNQKWNGGSGLFLEIVSLVIDWMHLCGRGLLGNQKIRGGAGGQ